MRRRHATNNDGDRQQGIERQAKPKAPAKYSMQRIVTIDSDADGKRCGYQRDGNFIPTQNAVESVCDEHGVGNIEADEGEEGAYQHDDYATVAELSPRLNHLRQSEFRALRSMEGDENRTEKNPDRTGQRGIDKAQSHARPNEADRDREEMEVSQEPEWSLFDDAAVAFVLGDIIDRFVLDSHPLPRPHEIRNLLSHVGESTDIAPIEAT